MEIKEIENKKNREHVTGLEPLTPAHFTHAAQPSPHARLRLLVSLADGAAPQSPAHMDAAHTASGTAGWFPPHHVRACHDRD